MEKGEATHLFAVDPRKIKSGEVPIEEVPYMQRAGGAWDGSDLKGAALRRAKKKQSQGMYTAGKWLDSDREYEENGPGVMSFFTQFNGGKQEKVEDRARQNGISQDAQLWRDRMADLVERREALRGDDAPEVGQRDLAHRRRHARRRRMNNRSLDPRDGNFRRFQRRRHGRL